MLKLAKLLQFLEYMALGAALAGLVGLIINLSVIYTLVPLVISLILNVINRQHLAKISEENQASSIRQVKEYQSSVEHLTDQLKSAIATFSLTDPNINSLAQNSELSKQLNSLVMAIEKLALRQNSAEKNIESLQTDLQITAKQFRQRPELTQIESLTSVIVDLQQFINQLPQWGSLQQQQLTELQQKVEQGLGRLTQLIDNLPTQVEEVVKGKIG